MVWEKCKNIPTEKLIINKKPIKNIEIDIFRYILNKLGVYENIQYYLPYIKKLINNIYKEIVLYIKEKLKDDSYNPNCTLCEIKEYEL